MQPHELLNRSHRSAGRFSPLGWLALVVVIGSALLSSRPTTVAAQSGGLAALERRVVTLETKIVVLEAAVSLRASEIAALQAALANEVTARQAAETTLQSHIDAEAAARQAADATLQSNVNAESAARASADTALQNRAAALENKTQYISIAGGDMFITGTNLNIRNGLGATNGNPADPFSKAPDSTFVNGKGNLIVGYNEFADHAGSHNVVIGFGNSYHSFGGLLVGFVNRLQAAYASITGGTGNIAAGIGSAVTGGVNNQAVGAHSAVHGGQNNRATGEIASVAGGLQNTAAGVYSAVTGGTDNQAVSSYSAVHGGQGNRTTGAYGVLLGGGSQTQSETITVILNTGVGPVRVTGYK